MLNLTFQGIIKIKEYILLRVFWNLVYLKVKKRNETSVYCVPAFVSGPVMGTLHKRLMEYGSGLKIIGPFLYALKET